MNSNAAQKTYSTQEAAMLFNVKPTTLLHSVSMRGHYMGLRPKKLPNRFLRWIAAEVDAVVQGKAR